MSVENFIEKLWVIRDSVAKKGLRNGEFQMDRGDFQTAIPGKFPFFERFFASSKLRKIALTIMRFPQVHFFVLSGIFSFLPVETKFWSQ